ncbi:MAG: hypothetical protein WDM85_15985 [Caulobacteraceae bacterium]
MFIVHDDQVERLLGGEVDRFFTAGGQHRTAAEFGQQHVHDPAIGFVIVDHEHLQVGRLGPRFDVRGDEFRSYAVSLWIAPPTTTASTPQCLSGA